MNEDQTSNSKDNQRQLQKIRDLFSRFIPSDEKIETFYLSLSILGITIGFFLLIRAFFCQQNNIIFYHGDQFVQSEIFRGYEGVILFYIGYFLQGIAINNSVSQKLLAWMKPLGQIIIFSGAVILGLGIWLWSTSLSSGYIDDDQYTCICIFSFLYSFLNFFLFYEGSLDDGMKRNKNWCSNSELLCCFVGILSFLSKSF